MPVFLEKEEREMYNCIHNHKHTRFNDLYTANVLQQIEEMGLKPAILSQIKKYLSKIMIYNISVTHNPFSEDLFWLKTIPCNLKRVQFGNINLKN